MSADGYRVPWLANFFHSFPHVDLTFHVVNSSYNPDSAKYREALLFWGALPILWLLVTLMVFLMYFCYRCCQKEPEKKRTGSCLPWTMAILAILACGAVGVGFFGNEETHNGILKFAQAGEDAENTIYNVQEQISELQDNINNTIDRRLKELRRAFQRHTRIPEDVRTQLPRLMNQAMEHTASVLAAVKKIDNRSHRVELQGLIGTIRFFGYWIWVGVILFMCWQILLYLLLLFGIGRFSKCTMLIFCACGIFTLVLCWVTAGVGLGLSVGMGDFCYNPDAYFEKLGSGKMDRDIVRYYIKCNNTIAANPFKSSLQDAQTGVMFANSTLAQAKMKARDYIRDDELNDYMGPVQRALDQTVVNVQHITALVVCNNIHNNYVDALEGACYYSFPGVVYVLLAASVTGLLLTVLVLLASCAWRHFGRKKGYREIDDEDNYLQRNDDASPSYYSFPRGRHNPREHLPMQRRSSPPPAYIPNDY